MVLSKLGTIQQGSLESLLEHAMNMVDGSQISCTGMYVTLGSFGACVCSFSFVASSLEWSQCSCSPQGSPQMHEETFR